MEDDFSPSHPVSRMARSLRVLVERIERFAPERQTAGDEGWGDLAEFAAGARIELESFDAHQYGPEEPLFLLRGRDLLALPAVLHWVSKAYASDLVPREKIQGALAVAAAMDAYRDRRMPD